MRSQDLEGNALRVADLCINRAFSHPLGFDREAYSLAAGLLSALRGENVESKELMLTSYLTPRSIS